VMKKKNELVLEREMKDEENSALKKRKVKNMQSASRFKEYIQLRLKWHQSR